MTCEWGAKLDRYLDSELSAVEAKEMEAHLRTCPACAAGALSRLQMKRMNQSAGQRFVPRMEFRRKIEHRVSLKQPSRWVARWGPASALAAAMAAILISAAVWVQYSRGDQAAGELADLHVSALASANPVDVVSSDRHAVKPWFQGKLPFTFNLPELQNSPFTLIGGRLTYFQQNPGAQLLFEIRKHQISVFIFQNRAELSRLNSGSSLRGKLAFSSESWTEGGLRYFVVGDASPSDIHDLCERLQHAARS